MKHQTKKTPSPKWWVFSHDVLQTVFMVCYFGFMATYFALPYMTKSASCFINRVECLQWQNNKTTFIDQYSNSTMSLCEQQRIHVNYTVFTTGKQVFSYIGSEMPCNMTVGDYVSTKWCNSTKLQVGKQIPCAYNVWNPGSIEPIRVPPNSYLWATVIFAAAMILLELVGLVVHSVVFAKFVRHYNRSHQGVFGGGIREEKIKVM
jgi:hypothetical protein